MVILFLINASRLISTNFGGKSSPYKHGTWTTETSSPTLSKYSCANITDISTPSHSWENKSEFLKMITFSIFPKAQRCNISPILSAVYSSSLIIAMSYFFSSKFSLEIISVTI